MGLNTWVNLAFAHKANIEKYQKILETYLTAEERQFVERRLNEEKTALEQLVDINSH